MTKILELSKLCQFFSVSSESPLEETTILSGATFSYREEYLETIAGKDNRYS